MTYFTLKVKNKLLKIQSILYIFLFSIIITSAQSIKNNISVEDTLVINEQIRSAGELIDSNPSESRKICTKALSFSDSINYNYGIAWSNYYLGLADFSLGNYKAAIHYFNQGIDIYNQISDKKNVGKSYNNIGNVYLKQGNYTAALEFYLKSLTISEELGDKKGIASTYHNIGNIHYEQFDFEKALEYYNKSIQLDSLISDNEGLAKTLMNVGAIYMEIADYPMALKNYYACLEIFTHNNDKGNIAICYNNIASVLQEMGEFDKAYRNYLEAIRIYKEIGSLHGVASTSYSIGSFYNSINNFQKALNYLEDALSIAKQIGSLRIEAGAALAISETYYHLTDYKKAYQYQVYYNRITNILNSEENVKELTRLQVQYEFDQKLKEEDFKRQQREAAHQAELRHQRLFISFLSIGLLLTIIMVSLIYRNYKLKQKDNILLAAQNLEIEKQRDEIEKQRDIATNQRDQIQKQKQEITDSIMYARKIQTAVLPPDEIVDKLFNENFILYKPRNIVSGDFYWMNEIRGKIVVAAADSTGHGVPGAFMSMLGVSFLNEIINSIETMQASYILDKLKALAIKSLHQTGKVDEAKDGMDISLIIIDKEKKKMQYAGAYNPVFIIRDNELIELKADRMPIGIFIRDFHNFTNHEIDISLNDRVYMFSDGYADQFGGENNQKFKTKNFKDLLMKIHDKPMEEQKHLLDINFENWKGNNDQIDDILVIGMKLKI